MNLTWDDGLREAENAAAALLQSDERIMISVDGRAASGKTTFAAELADRIGCQVVHMDDFYLQPYQRTDARMEEAGGNVDYERVMHDVIEPWSRDGRFSYRPYDPHSKTWGDAIYFEPAPVVIMEGSYSGHPALRSAQHLNVFITTDAETQLSRISRRNGPEAVGAFRDKWIPMEEKYFAAFSVADGCDLIIET